MKWIAISGEFDFDEPITFRGKPTAYTDTTGEVKMGLGIGIAISNENFSGGDISMTVTFEKVDDLNSCEIIFYYDAMRREHVAAGIGGPESAFVIRHFDGQRWSGAFAQSGTRQTIRAGQAYELRVAARGSRVILYVNGIEVLGYVLPFSLPPSQVGIFCLDDSTINISDFKVNSRRGDVFVVMQFSSPFNEIHEEIVKKVCAEFNLNALRGDETYGPGVILSDITTSIDESEFIIAEITPANANVYYELGYAHAINKPVILLADRSMEKLPFDVSSFRVLFYDNSMIGRSKFEDGLRRHISAIMTKNAILPAMSGVSSLR